MIKPVLLVILAALSVLVILILRQPSEFTISRSWVIPAASDTIFPHVNNLHNWHAWSPWAKLDPAAQETFAGPDAGTGASMTWSGNKEVGEGAMTITDSKTNEFVRFRLDFVKPFKATSEAQFIFEPQGDATKVTWTMSGTNNFIGKAISLFMDCTKMVGAQFEKGLQSLSQTVQQV